MSPEALGALLRAGEGATIEFKRELPDVERVGATLCAFANGAGGHLIVGIRDDGYAAGVADPSATADGLSEAASRLLPVQPIDVMRIDYRGVPFVVARVESAPKPPVLYWHADGEEVPYVRVDASTRRASRADLKASWTARGFDADDDDLDDDEVDALVRIRAMTHTGLRSVVTGLKRGTRAGRNLVKALQRRGYLVRDADGRIALTALAHAALDRRAR